MNLLSKKGFSLNKIHNSNKEFKLNNQNLFRNSTTTQKEINNNNRISNKSTSKKNIENKKFYYENGNPKEKASQKEVSLISLKQDYSTITRFTNKSIIQAYLDRRHLETQKKIIRLRHEKLADECSGFSFKPVISENSKKIVRNIIERENPERVMNSTFIGNHNPAVDCNYNNNYNATNNNFGIKCHNRPSSEKKNMARRKFTKFDDYLKIAERRGVIINNFSEKEKNVNLII